MLSDWKKVLSLALAVAAVGCAQPESEQAPAAAEPAAEQVQDATVVDPVHYKVEFENERMRVVRITYGPGEASVMHHHPDHVAVMLSDGHFAFEAADGSSQEMQFAAGEHIFAPAGNHRPKNLTEATMKAVLVELK